jgi:hypothetical protein
MFSLSPDAAPFQLVTISDSGIHGVGLFSTADMMRNQVLGHIEEKQVRFAVSDGEESERIKNWIGLDADEWIDTSNSIFRFINHSCEPNVALFGRKVIATRDIRKGDEVVMDYSLTDADEHWTIQCNCKRAGCRQNIGSIYSLSLADYMQRKHIIHLPFRKLFEERHPTFGSMDLGLQLQSA